MLQNKWVGAKNSKMIFNYPLIAVCAGNEQKYYRFSLKATEETQ